jgi:hypothetical protein
MLRRLRWTWRRLTALHEAGHAVAAVAHGIAFGRVAVLGGDVGMIVLVEKLLHDQPGFDPDASGARRDAENFVIMALAGEIAEASCSGREPDFSPGGEARDYAVATELAGRLFAAEMDRVRFLAEMDRRTRAFVADPVRRRQIEAVAARLDRAGELNGDQVKRIMAEVGGPSAEDRPSS